MALKVSGYSSTSLTHKIVEQSTVTQTADVDVLGTSGTLHSCTLLNSHSAIVYIKFFLTTGEYAAGVTEPDLMFRLPATTSRQLDFPAGLEFSQLTFWANDGAATNDTDSPGGTVAITAVCS